MFLLKETTFFIFIQITASYGWPATYSKSAATYGEGAYDDEVDWSQHPCKRECKDDEESMTCHYGFTIENYATMTRACYDCPSNVTDCYRPHCIPGDGNSRMVLVVNRRLPGPSIEVCKGDRIIVDVKNMLYSRSTTIHWHGLHQVGTPYMDGVPMISQCPISAGGSFRYVFKAGNTGTHWWHAHSGFQRGDGLFGSLIVRKPSTENLVGHLYDRDEHVIILNEWNEHAATEAYLLLYHASRDDPHTILINGLGRYEGNNSESPLIPRPVFHVKKGTRHRFRLINAGSFQCAFSITVDEHPLLVVSTDGADVEPIEVDAIRLAPGERYDFVLEANRQIDNYWIRISGSDNCGAKETHQEAILRYEGAADTEPQRPTGFDVGFKSKKRILNPHEEGSETPGAMCIPCSLTSLEHDEVSLAPIPDYRYYLSLDYHALDSPEYYRKNLYDTHQVPTTSFMMQINHLSFVNPKYPLQTQPELIQPDQLCNVTEAKCTREQCSCPHVLQLKLNSTVEIVFVSPSSRNRLTSDYNMIVHPMHIHGFYYRVLAMEKLGIATSSEEVRAWDLAGKINRKLIGAPRKDVLDVLSGGYAVARFRADNPGYWFLHCHFESHAQNGMAMVLQVGEHKDFPPVPKDLSKCPYHSDSLISNTSTSSQNPLYNSYGCNMLLTFTVLINLAYLY